MGFIYNFCSVLETLRNTCSSSAMPILESSSQESKRQRLSSDGVAKPGNCSPGSASFWREVGHQASHVYLCLGIRLGRQNKLTDALHFLRMSLQMEKGWISMMVTSAVLPIWRVLWIPSELLMLFPYRWNFIPHCLKDSCRKHFKGKVFDFYSFFYVTCV